MMSSTFFAQPAGGPAHPTKGLLATEETISSSLLTPFQPHGIICVSGVPMNFRRKPASPLVYALAALCALAPWRAAAQSAQAGASAPQATLKDAGRGDAYYNYTMGHIAEEMFESTGRSEYATQAIGYYKKAYALDPASAVIGERLAEIYWKGQRTREAVQEAQEILKRDSNNLPTRRLLGRIYLRSLGDMGATVRIGGGQPDGSSADTPASQPELIKRAIEQYREIVRLDSSDTESALWLARLYRLQNSHDKAEEVLRGLLKEDPENEMAAEQLTQLLLDRGKSADAVALVEGIIGHASPSAALFDLLGDAYTQTKELAKAENAYRKAAELDPAEVSHLRGLGQTLLAEEKYQDALGVFQRLAEMEPDDADTYLRLAQIYRELKQPDQAEENLLKARQKAPGSIEVTYNEAMLYESQGRYEDAIRVLSDAAAGIKNQANAVPSSRRALAILYQQLGQLYREKQNFQAAIYSFEEMQRLGEDEDRRARLLIMDTYRSAKDMPRALDAAKAALEKYPSDRAVLSSRALLMGENGQTDEAVKTLRTQLNGTAEDRDTYINIAQVYERGRRYKEAENAARLAEALPGPPRDNEMVWFLLGAIYERQKLYDRAEEEFKRALAVNPKNAAALNYYGYMLGDLGIRLDEAGALVQRALAEEPNSGAYQDSLGWVYFKQNNLAQAETWLRKAAEHESHDPTIHSHLGDVYFRAGRKDLAATEWEKSLAEWHRAFPTEIETEKVADLEKKLTQVKHRIAQQKSPAEASKPE